MNTLPPKVRWKADNYNHLMEQPTIFYPIIIILAMMGHGDGVNLTWAWVYVGLRVVHSFFQSLVNIIEIRFTRCFCFQALR
ncbi:MAG: MAPEG family protein [Bacteriovoracaceae bacterium]